MSSVAPLGKLEFESPRSKLETALEQIATRAGELDANPRFPSENFADLRAAGVPQRAANRVRSTLGEEIAVIRALASADSSTARILDGHFNGVERLALGAPSELRSRELEHVGDGSLLLGVWGADPAPGEGEPASIREGPDGAPVLRGVKTFCSGAGGVQRALVIAGDQGGARRLAYVGVDNGSARGGIRIDRSWYRASGLRASESHRVEFLDTPVLAILGRENEASREPWFARDAVRTASTWAGIADGILRATLAAVGGRALDDLRLHGVGRIRVAQASIDRWLEYSVPVLEQAGAESEKRREDELPTSGAARALAGECRVALADAARTIAAEAAIVCGSRALIGGGALDRGRRDLDLFLLQHRLDPKIVELGSRTLEQAGP